jgi:hypothetical protein
VLHTEHFEALATLVKLLETFDLIFSHIDLLLYLLEFVFNLTLFAVKVLQLDTESVSTLVGTGQLFSPSFVRFSVTLKFFIHASSNKAAIRHIVRIVVDRVVKFKFLLMTTGFGHHVKFPSLQYITCESFNHLIL